MQTWILPDRSPCHILHWLFYTYSASYVGGGCNSMSSSVHWGPYMAADRYTLHLYAVLVSLANSMQSTTSEAACCTTVRYCYLAIQFKH
jgi:hypothetical protein